jgi:hypothetical protein
MILSRWQDRLLVVLQPDHGVQTGLFADAWGNEEVPPVQDHRHASTLAARHHDDGWAVWERRPTMDPETGRPVQFHRVIPSEHIEAYRAGIIRAAQHDPWAGLLVSMHGVGLYNDRYGSYRLAELATQELDETETAVVAEFFTDMARLQQRLAGQSLGHDVGDPAHADPLIRHHYLLLQVWDRLSLQFAFRHAADERIAPLPSLSGEAGALVCRSAGAMALTLDPYPFVEDHAAFPVRGFLLEDRPYTDPEDFIAALTAAAPLNLDCTVSRPQHPA